MTKQHISCLILILLCGVSGFAQSRRKGQTSVSRAGDVSNIRQVDFKNFTHSTSSEGSQGKQIARLKDGVYVEREDGDVVYTATLDDGGVPIAYGDLTGDGKEEAVVILVESTGGNGVSQHGIIYTLKSGQVVKLAEFENVSTKCFDDGDECAFMRVKIENKLLLIDKEVMADGNASCCYRTIKYRPDGNRLVEIGKTRIMRRP